MKTPPVLRIAVPAPLRRTFDYLPCQGIDLSQLKAGMRVRVPFRKKELVGIFLEVMAESDVPVKKLKQIVEVMDVEPMISGDMLALCTWAADYYHYPIGEVIAAAMPVLLRQPTATPAPLAEKTEPRALASVTKLADAATLPNGRGSVAVGGGGGEESRMLSLNAAQAVALNAITTSLGQFHVSLLDGVTGSGKTEVYLQAIATVLQQSKQVLVLVPEIGLTPQTIQRFRERFSIGIVTLHSGMTEKQRLQAWMAAQSGEAKIVIGTRSAVFTPFTNLGLIIIDEEHDVSFKQQDSFRYHARDVAIMRAYQNNISIVLGSATPSLETLHNAQQKRYQHLVLPERAGGALMPQYQLLDIRNAKLEEGLSPALLQEIKNHLHRGEQVMLFLNRRGFSPVLMCHACGWTASCKRCDMRLTYHQKPDRLHCHHCDAQKKVFSACEVCGEKELHPVGQGTERLENALEKYFPDFSIVRIDRDSTRRKGSMEKALARIQSGEHHILIGTQMLAKGHHFPNVTLVAVIDADGGFFSSDFRALERMGQLILQVAGRAGRVEKPGKVIIQTHHPDHPLLYQLLYETYQTFSATLLNEREQAQLPPYRHFALFRAEAHSLENATDFLRQVKSIIDTKNATLQIMGPIGAPLPRRAGRHRVQLLIQAAQRPALQRMLKTLLPKVEKLKTKSRVRWSLDVDPSEMC